MTSQKIMILVCTVILLACPATGVEGADPYWLRSWNEAERIRPSLIDTHGRIAPADEPGTPLTIHGRVVQPDGRTPSPGVVVHAYHRDRNGLDFGAGDRSLSTWRLQGWARTDSEGRFRFDTIRPAADHMGREGAHIHFSVASSEFGRQWAPTVYFSDDPLVGERERARSAAAGAFGGVREVRTVDGGGQELDVRIRLKDAADF